MIEHVVKGQRIAAAHMNNLIDSINQNDAFIDEYVANTPGGMPMLPKSFILESVSKTTGDLSALSTTLSAIGCYNIRFGDGKSKEPLSANNKIWTTNLDSISAIWLVKEKNSESLSVLNNVELASVSNLSAMNKWKLYEVEVSSDANGFAIVNDYRDIAFSGIAETGEAEPYGVFRFQGNTGTTEDDTPKPCGTTTHCNVQVGRQLYKLNNETETTDGMWAVRVAHGSMTGVFFENVGNYLPNNALSVTYIPIFKIQNQEVVEDYRGMPTIPCWGDEEM